MTTMTYPYQSQLRSQGREEGREEGRAEGEARFVLRVLARRGVEVPDEVRQRVMSCTDDATLESWLDRALTAESAEDLFV
jgi:predicted transposase YdaD